MNEMKDNIIKALLSFNFRLSRITINIHDSYVQYELKPEKEMKLRRFIYYKKKFLKSLSVSEPKIFIDKKRHIIVMTHKIDDQISQYEKT